MQVPRVGNPPPIGQRRACFMARLCLVSRLASLPRARPGVRGPGLPFCLLPCGDRGPHLEHTAARRDPGSRGQPDLDLADTPASGSPGSRTLRADFCSSKMARPRVFRKSSSEWTKTGSPDVRMCRSARPPLPQRGFLGVERPSFRKWAQAFPLSQPEHTIDPLCCCRQWF